jgi:3-deoxy-manno-octulosonate cytidylyltransferase (CMP-KDO synthetase)
MAPILGLPMVEHVYRRVSSAKFLTTTAVATCDEEIFKHISSLGGHAIMTSNQHERASDRCAEALLKLEEHYGFQYDVVIMVQGDEPMTKPEMLAEAVKPFFEDPSVQVTNLLGKIQNDREFEDRNCIKVVCDLNLNALYFSREPIPTRAKLKTIPMGKQVCVIPFRRDYLLAYTRLSPTPLEVAESIDMMRVLEHGHKVRMVPTDYSSFAVDTPSDLMRVEEIMSLEKSS